MNDAESAINVLRSCADGNRSISVYPREARSLVDHLNHLAAENERLAREAAYLKACSPPTKPSDYGHEAWAETVRAAVAQERAAIVAWLRGEAESLTGTTTATAFRVSVGLSDAADAIERGAHR